MTTTKPQSTTEPTLDTDMLAETGTVICPVCKDEVPEDSMFSYNHVPNAFCQGCVDSGKV